MAREEPTLSPTAPRPSGSLPGEAQAALDEARRVLLPPLRFAARDDFAAVGRLKGFGSLLVGTLARLGGLPDDVRGALATAGASFDDLDAAARRERVAAILALLHDDEGPAGGPPPAPAAPSAPSSARSSAPSSPPPSTSGRDVPARAPAPRPAPSPSSAAGPLPDERGDPQGSGLAPRARHDQLALEDESTRLPPRVDPQRADLGPRILDAMQEPASVLPGIGPRKAEALRERDLGTVGALLYTLPRTYDDRRRVRPLGDLEVSGTSVVQGQVVSAGQVGRGRGARFEIVLDDGTGRLKLVFFRFKPYDMNRRYQKGDTLTAVGEVARYGGTLQMVHPSLAHGERTEEMSGIWPVYPEVRGLHPAELGRTVRAAAQRLLRRPVKDLVPAPVREGLGLPEINDALLDIHLPPPDLPEEALARLANRNTRAHYRLAFDEVFVLQLALGLRRRSGAVEQAPALPGEEAVALWEELLPFAPTGAQARAVAEILEDLEGHTPMGRLLQGDVGAGKTAVAAAAALRAVRAGAQVAIMAPTEILAEQHHATFQRLFSPLGIRVDLFAGGLRGKARRLKVARLQNREIQIAVGTHALLSDDVAFKRLALCVIDEQHRFGVVQRMQLKAKGPSDGGRSLVPHVLVMTATPIPRSLALTVYGDLAVSVLDELPPGRTPVETHVLTKAREDVAVKAIAELLQRNERAYVVYPLIEESEKMDLADATRGYEVYKKHFGEDRVALLHGRVPTDEREVIMGRFVRGEVSVLVSTTVIEVGVDVPEATCMVVKHAERFGLSQLHQLRGRVGRSHRKSRCYLVVGEDGAGKDGYRRLKVMEQTGDGFRIAEEDLAIRGPGDFLGTRQHGLPTFAFADLAEHAWLIDKARRIAERVLEDDPTLARPEHEDLRTLVYERFADRLALAGVG